MEREDFYTKQENNEGFVKKAPLTKAFSEARLHETNLPTELTTNPELLRECGERKHLIDELDTIYTKIPTLTTIDVALEKGLVSQNEAEQFYTTLIKSVESDKESNRVLLYFPIELLPDASNESLQFFTTFYKKNWKELLNDIDVREGFNIGDIPEKELRNSPLAKVSKAAHLIPFLIEKNIISKNDVLTMIESEGNEALLESTLDTLPILVDKDYIDNEDLALLEKSKKVSVRNTINMIRHELTTPTKEIAQETEKLSVDDLFDSMNVEINNIQNSLLEDTDSIPEARTKWLLSSKKELILEKYAESLYKKLHNNTEEIEKVLENKTISEEGAIVFIKSLEKLLITNPRDSTLYTALNALKGNATVPVKNALLQTFQRLQSAGMLHGDYVSTAELENVELEIEKSVERKIKNVLSHIETDPLLARCVYPVALLYGSHIKGYGKENSDTDISVFVKEEIDFDKHTEIKNAFTELLKELHIEGSVMEFWLKTNNDGSLWIQDFENSDTSLGDSIITSPLTGNWYGDEKAVQHLQSELIPNYLYSEDKKIEGIEARKIWMRDLERNMIQYRLMHKGYKEKNLAQGGIDSPHKHEIDGESMFYDSGFRRLATKIYLEKVFLPQLKKE